MSRRVWTIPQTGQEVLSNPSVQPFKGDKVSVPLLILIPEARKSECIYADGELGFLSSRGWVHSAT